MSAGTAARTLERRTWKPVAQFVALHLQQAAAPPVRRMSTFSNFDKLLPNVVFGSVSGRSWAVVAAAHESRRSLLSLPQVRWASGSANAIAKEEEAQPRADESAEKSSSAASGVVSSNYWGIAPTTHFREDGAKWPWNCFKPSDTYYPDTNIDLLKHHVPRNWQEKLAYWTVKTLRVPTDLFFKTRYGCRAMMLETVAGIPGMVGGMTLHLRSLRRFEHSGGWIKALLDEAENERMHLMTMMELVKPVWYERALVVAVQGIFFNAYFLFYLLSPKVAHRFVGYLEEEAIYSYTSYIKQIDDGEAENVPAPAIAIDYWRLPKDAKLRDVIVAIRADEAHHRDVNHYASEIRVEGKQLNESPAPVDYH